MYGIMYGLIIILKSYNYVKMKWMIWRRWKINYGLWWFIYKENGWVFIIFNNRMCL